MPAMRTESASFIAHGLVQEGGGGKEEGGVGLGDLLLSFLFLALVHGVVSKMLVPCSSSFCFCALSNPIGFWGGSLFNCRLSRALLFCCLRVSFLLYIYLKGGG